MKRSKKFRYLAHLQAIAFGSLLVCGSGDSYANLIGVVLSLSLLVLTTAKLKRYGM